MDKVMQDRIYGMFPEIFREHSLPLSESCMAYGLCIEDGWTDLLIRLCEDLQKMMYEGNFIVVAKQVKQKLGQFRMYVGVEPLDNAKFDNDYWFKKVHERIQQSSNESTNICEICGEPGSRMGDFYIYIGCDKHKNFYDHEDE